MAGCAHAIAVVLPPEARHLPRRHRSCPVSGAQIAKPVARGTRIFARGSKPVPRLSDRGGSRPGFRNRSRASQRDRSGAAGSGHACVATTSTDEHARQWRPRRTPEGARRRQHRHCSTLLVVARCRWRKWAMACRSASSSRYRRANDCAIVWDRLAPGSTRTARLAARLEPPPGRRGS